MKFLFSTKMSIVLLFIMAGAMAVATFVENDFGTLVAREFVYEAWWFEAIMIWLSINFIFHIKQYNLFSKAKLPVGLLHLAFIIIIIGAGITRYISQEGMVHIRVNQVVSDYTTNEKYIQFRIGEEVFYKKSQPIPYFFSTENLHLTDKEVIFDCTLTEFIPKAVSKFVEGDETYIDISITSQEDEGADYILKRGENQRFNFFSVEFENKELPQAEQPNFAYFRIKKNDGVWQFWSDIPLHSIHLQNEQMATLEANKWIDIQLHTIYRWAEGSFMINGFYENKKQIFVSQTHHPTIGGSNRDVVKLEVKANGKLINEHYFEANKNIPQWQVFDYQGNKYAYAYASKQSPLPFSLKLNKFELKRYPGSESPESYTSFVEVIGKKETFPYQIFMNNVLDYQGYRLYQSSYDKDEQGTLLALNKDRWGTWITYLGYGILFLAMSWIFFVKGSRFGFLNKRLKKVKQGKIFLLIIFALSPFYSFSHDIEKYIVPKEKAYAYGKLIVQDLDGRMKPLTTLAYEIARKLTGRTSITLMGKNGEKHKISPEQFLLAIQLNPEVFSEVPVIQVNTKKARLIYEILNIEPASTLRFVDFLDNNGSYQLKRLVEEVNRLKPAERSESQKELLKIDERFNILFNIFAGNFLRLYPNKKAENNKWFTANQFSEFDKEDADFVKNIHSFYLDEVRKGVENDSFFKADEALSYLEVYQKEAGIEVYPSESQIKSEIFYTRVRIGNYLFGVCIVLGSILLAVAIALLFFRNHILRIAFGVGEKLSRLVLVIFTFDLGLRWYIAKHPPWSDGFEMLLFVSWGVLLFGIFFARKSPFTLPLGLLFSGVLLLVSFLDWLNPEITTLKPVLHSYWLKIHVAVIVSSYAPLALSCVMALLSLMLLIFKPVKPTEKWWQSMKEIIIVQEMAVTIGLFLLTAGTFLGGIWANESWGRYWAWDPKETWALISIVIYSALVHLRLIPSMKNALVYHLATMWSFSTIIMTSFGVNYYLVGLHSYATGDPVPIPKWVYFSVLFLIVVSLYAVFSYRKLSEEEKLKIGG